MRLNDFETMVRRLVTEVPPEFLVGVHGVEVSRSTLPHPARGDIWTLGECIPLPGTDQAGDDGLQSRVVLYHGSFQALARVEEGFDWRGEAWETLTHELRHHLEALAGEDALEDVDYAADELFKRQEGLDFDPWYYQHGEDLGGGVYVVEGGFYLEQVWEPPEWERTKAIDFEWRGASYRIRRPAELGDVHFVSVRGPDLDEEALEVVLVRKRGWREGLRGLMGAAKATTVLVTEVEAERASD